MSIIDQIDLSLEKASSLQQKRFEAEESKQKSLNYELNQLRSQFDESLEDQDEGMTPERSHSQNFSQSQYSPLRNDIKQLELQKQLLQSSERKLQEEVDDSDNDDNQEQIYPKYEKNNLKSTQQEYPHQKQFQYQGKKDNRSQKDGISKTRSKKYQKENTQVKKDLQQKTQKYIPKTTEIITTTIERRNEKENNYVIQDQRPEYQKLKQHIKSVKEQVSHQLIKNEKIKQETQQNEEKQYKIRGYRDQAEIKYFGRPLPCNECVFLLNKGMSSDYCSQHGKMNKERPPNKTLPKRLAKFF
ncbi:unnamed protein product [Paramecium sonneborni]|uniref:Uncharacterized protein n=1 Tax=Paramecium sonneborni TaxID=65129 RepID=A0A8S1MRQ1_9CILI|nr:unnamed protein product [Paramecium sonneborni]